MNYPPSTPWNFTLLNVTTLSFPSSLARGVGPNRFWTGLGSNWKGKRFSPTPAAQSDHTSALIPRGVGRAYTRVLSSRAPIQTHRKPHILKLSRESNSLFKNELPNLVGHLAGFIRNVIKENGFQAGIEICILKEFEGFR